MKLKRIYRGYLTYMNNQNSSFFSYSSFRTELALEKYGLSNYSNKQNLFCSKHTIFERL